MSLNVGCAARPGNARDNKTGSWRVFKPEIDNEKCTKCGTCILVCPDVCITEENDTLVVDYAFCKGCGLCAKECPADAITMKQEEK